MSLERKKFTFNDTEHYIEIYIGADRVPWFLAINIAKILDYTDTNQAVRNYVHESNILLWKDIQKNIIEIVEYKHPKTYFINEPGVYTLCLRSKKPEAIIFQEWITSEVLPQIRKTGAYISPNITKNQLNDLLKQIEQQRKEIDTQKTEIADLHKNIDTQKSHITYLCGRIDNQKPDIAPIPEDEELQHVFLILQHKEIQNLYKFIRRQQRSLYKIKDIFKDYKIILSYERTPNAINILNKTKEKMKAIKTSYKVVGQNGVQTDCDIISIATNVINEAFKDFPTMNYSNKKIKRF